MTGKTPRPRAGPAAAFLAWAGQLRFPFLAALTAVLFVVDLVVPDMIPFADEVLLGLATLLFGMWRKRPPPDAARIDHGERSRR